MIKIQEVQIVLKKLNSIKMIFYYIASLFNKKGCNIVMLTV